MKIVSVVRGKNGLRYWPRLLLQLTKVGDITVILDDYSTDGSYEWLCQRAKEVPNVLIIRQPDVTYNGGRDWNVIYEFIDQFKPNWIFQLDCDELLEEGQEDSVRLLAEQSGADVLGWSFPFYYLWNDDQHYRSDGEYYNTRVIRLFRYYSNLRPPKRISHSTCLPDELDRRMIRVANVRMWHYGYMLPEDRLIKHKFYTTRDKDPKAAGAGSANYDHMLQDTEDDQLNNLNFLNVWKDLRSYLSDRLGNFLLQAPRRASVGAFFPTAKQMSMEELLAEPADAFDEIRINYVFDGLDVTETKELLIGIRRILRPGGRLEVLATNFKAVCARFAATDVSKEERLNMKSVFDQTPLLKPVRTMYTYELLTEAMQEAGYEDWQEVALKGYPYRLYCIAYKHGEPKWV